MRRRTGTQSPLRHPVLGVPLPWLDSRAVSQRCVQEYLDVGEHAFGTLANAGCFDGEGCRITLGSRVAYIPARIWAANSWAPPAELLPMLTAAPAPVLGKILEQIDGLARQVRMAVDPAGAAKAGAL